MINVLCFGLKHLSSPFQWYRLWPGMALRYLNDLGFLVGHFNFIKTEPLHKMNHMRFLPFEVVPSGDPMELASRESYWIEKKQLLEFGLNRQK